MKICGKIIRHLDLLTDAVQNMEFAVYTGNRVLAEWVNLGNGLLRKCCHRIVTVLKESRRPENRLLSFYFRPPCDFENTF